MESEIDAGNLGMWGHAQESSHRHRYPLNSIPFPGLPFDSLADSNQLGVEVNRQLCWTHDGVGGIFWG